MSKHVLSNNIATGVRQPYTKVTHEWYNAMIDEAVNALSKGLVGTNSNFTVLYGCINSAAPNANISAGAIFYNGEIYLCPAFVDGAISNDIVGTITTAYATGDPILFSDGNSFNVHQVKTIVWSDAASGSGSVDFADLKYNQVGCDLYTPTFQGYDNGGSPIAGFSATDAGCGYAFTGNTLVLNIRLNSVTTTTSIYKLGISLPSGVINSQLLAGSCFVQYYDGSSYSVKKANIYLSESGAGNGLEVSNTNGAAFTSASGGTLDFTITIIRY